MRQYFSCIKICVCKTVMETCFLLTHYVNRMQEDDGATCLMTYSCKQTDSHVVLSVYLIETTQLQNCHFCGFYRNISKVLHTFATKTQKVLSLP